MKPGVTSSCISAAIMVLLACPVLEAGSAKENYQTAVQLLRDKQTDQGQIIKKLISLRDECANKDNKSREDEIYLTKISSLLYWQNKFNSLNASDPKAEIKESRPDPQDEEESSEAMDAELAKLDKDPYSLLLYYLKYQENARNSKDGAMALTNIEKYYQIYNNENKEIVKAATASIDNYASLCKNKRFDKILPALSQIIKQGELDERTKAPLIHHFHELKAMAQVMTLLKTTKLEEKVPIEDRSLGIEGFITAVSDTGITYYANDDIGESNMSWSSVEEQFFYKIARDTIKGNNSSEKLLLAILELKLKNYNKAFDHFYMLSRNDPDIMLKYRSFLEQCEMEYRLDSGKKVEEYLSTAEELHGKGDNPRAIHFLTLLKNDYIALPLAHVFRKRYLTTYGKVSNKG